MLRVDKETLDRMESQHKGIIEQIMHFENAVLPSCPNCQSDNTADVQVDVIGRAVYIAAATSKFKLILNGPRPGRCYCNDCGKYFGVADSQPGGFTDRRKDSSFQAFKKFFDDFTSALKIKGTVSEERLLQTWRKLWNLPPDARPEDITEGHTTNEPARALSIRQPYGKISIAKFIRATKKLPQDEPVLTPGVWYKTQKEHWLGWLKEYNGPGAYGRIPGQKRDARYAYNHIVNHQMLLWIVEAAGVSPDLVKTARRAAEKVDLMQQKSAAIRKHVPWDVLAEALWGYTEDK